MAPRGRDTIRHAKQRAAGSPGSPGRHGPRRQCAALGDPGRVEVLFVRIRHGPASADQRCAGRRRGLLDDYLRSVTVRRRQPADVWLELSIRRSARRWSDPGEPDGRRRLCGHDQRSHHWAWGAAGSQEQMVFKVELEAIGAGTSNITVGQPDSTEVNPQGIAVFADPPAFDSPLLTSSQVHFIGLSGLQTSQPTDLSIDSPSAVTNSAVAGATTPMNSRSISARLRACRSPSCIRRKIRAATMPSAEIQPRRRVPITCSLISTARPPTRTWASSRSPPTRPN